MVPLVLIRHGKSVWNVTDRFTGWVDVDLHEEGFVQAHQAAKLLKENVYTFDVAFTSLLKRAIRTLWIVLDDLDLLWLPVHKTWRLNERHYGALQGLNKVTTMREFGEKQFMLWRRSFDVPPPPLSEDDERWTGRDRRYKDIPSDELPRTECLKDTMARVLPYWHEKIAPELKAGKRALIAAHGNSLRSLVKHLDDVSDQDIVGLNIPTGIPLVYELDDNLKPLRHYYLGDPEDVRREAEAVAAQGKK